MSSRTPIVIRLALCAAMSLASAACSDRSGPVVTASPLRVGVAAVPITPCGNASGWDGPITVSGVWGEVYDDLNGNDRYDPGEPFTDDPRNEALDPTSKNKWDGIYMAGFNSGQVPLGCHDDVWARTIVIEDGDRRVSITVVDTVGMLTRGSYAGFGLERTALEAELDLDWTVFASTHNHQGPDTMGLWGPDLTVDGKFPLYLRYIDSQVSRSLREAVAALAPVAEVRAFATDPEESPELLGLQVRTGCRPPWVFDTELRGLAFLGADGRAIGSLVSWGTHPESLEDENVYISSDFPHWIRGEVEAALGGLTVYASADLGAAEIVGDTCVTGADPRHPDGSNEYDRRDDIGFPRTESIGRTVGGVVARGLVAAEPLDVARLEVRRTDYRVAASNPLFELGRQIGILDLDPAAYDPALCPGAAGLCGPAENTLIELRDGADAPLVQIVTLPGEVFPELFLGVEEHKRTDCPQANTGFPYEPSILERMTAPYRLVIGLSPDEIGYIVPGYDFYPGEGIDTEAEDPCQGQNYDPAVPRRTVPAHYHETLSVGIEAGSWITCKTAELLAGPASIADEPACLALE